MRLIFAVNLARKYSDILTDEGVSERLFSYWLLRDTNKKFLPEYVDTGRLPVRQKTKTKRKELKV